jgi:hypothetical protein
MNKVAVIYRDSQIIGWCPTFLEADDICKYDNTLKWSTKQIEKLNCYKQLVLTKNKLLILE